MVALAVSGDVTEADRASFSGNAVSAGESVALADLGARGSDVLAANLPNSSTTTAVVSVALSVGVGRARGESAGVGKAVDNGEGYTFAGALLLFRRGRRGGDATALLEAVLILLSLESADLSAGSTDTNSSALGFAAIVDLAGGDEVLVGGAAVVAASTAVALDGLSFRGRAELLAALLGFDVVLAGDALALLGSNTLAVDITTPGDAAFVGTIVDEHLTGANVAFGDAVTVAVPAAFSRGRGRDLTLALGVASFEDFRNGDSIAATFLFLDGLSLLYTAQWANSLFLHAARRGLLAESFAVIAVNNVDESIAVV